jgi:hypothetical protein
MAGGDVEVAVSSMSGANIAGKRTFKLLSSVKFWLNFIELRKM